MGSDLHYTCIVIVLFKIISLFLFIYVTGKIISTELLIETAAASMTLNVEQQYKRRISSSLSSSHVSDTFKI